MEKILKFPEDLLSGCSTTAVLRLDGASVIGQCIVTAGQHGTFFLRQHMLYVVLGGKVELRTGHQRVTLHKNEMVMLRKYSTIEYSKSGNGATGVFESMLFAIRDDFLREFISSVRIDLAVYTDTPRPSPTVMQSVLVAVAASNGGHHPKVTRSKFSHPAMGGRHWRRPLQNITVQAENVSRRFAIQPQSQAVCTAIDPRFHINRRFRCFTLCDGWFWSCSFASLGVLPASERLNAS